jgi:hypothetical protein
MSDQDQNLRVVTDHINELAKRQRTAADKITGANRGTGNAAADVLGTHGLVCWATSTAVSTAEEARTAAGAKLYQVSAEFSEKLTTAAINYNDADYRARKSLGRACRM